MMARSGPVARALCRPLLNPVHPAADRPLAHELYTVLRDTCTLPTNSALQLVLIVWINSLQILSICRRPICFSIPHSFPYTRTGIFKRPNHGLCFVFVMRRKVALMGHDVSDLRVMLTVAVTYQLLCLCACWHTDGCSTRSITLNEPGPGCTRSGTSGRARPHRTNIEHHSLPSVCYYFCYVIVTARPVWRDLRWTIQ